ncbi:MAG: helix-turn-helix transcriptional regulator [Treponema sp.]|nr:helix-turn-helix transcriptional regulator [Treponema sp.]
MEFWIRLKALMKSQKITQEKLCKTCDISLATFVSWIHNNRLPDLLSAIKIAQTLGTTVEFLVTGKNDNAAEQQLKELKAKLADLIMFKK